MASNFCDPVVGWITQNKVSTVLGVLLFCFFISTIALAVQKNNLNNELDKCSTDDTTVTPAFEYRLEGNIVPKSYFVRLQPHFDKDSYEGIVRIQFEVVKNTQYIILHKGVNINIDSATLTNDPNVKLTSEVENDMELVRIHLSRGLRTTKNDEHYELEINFSSVNMSQMTYGFYISEYTNEGSTHQVASSKFEPTYARQAFPCFDEPGYKTPFTVELIRPKDGKWKALSNMNILNSNEEGDHAIVSFAPSVTMSTYLMEFIVGEFDIAKTGKINDEIVLNVYMALGRADFGEFAYDVAHKVTEFYIKYFGVDYPLPKLDLIAIPKYPSGATEHWGIITFRETTLMLKVAESSAKNQKSVASVISHELVHQWFGNLVTMQWWDDIWLNEGFASYIEYKGLQEFYPDVNIMDHFTVDDMHSVMITDATQTTRPIVQDASTQTEITALFDSIAYNKAASVIRMLEDFVGEENFKKGVHDYLEKHKMENTVTDDFFAAFDGQNLGFIVKDVMHSWINEPGFPVVTVDRAGNKLTLTQERFFTVPSEKPNPNEAKWTIPIRYRANTGNSKLVWFDSTEEKLEITLDGTPTWYKINDDQLGYYRVKYDSANWDALIEQLKKTTPTSTELSVLNRANLINDAFALADSTLIDYDVPLRLIEYIPFEHHLIPISTAITNLKAIYPFLQSSGEFLVIMGIIQQQFNETYHEIHWSTCEEEEVAPTPKDDEVEKCKEVLETDFEKNLLREKIVDFMCYIGDSDCRSEAQERLSLQLTNTKDLDPNIATAAYYYGIGNNVNTFDQVYDIYKASIDPQERSRIALALSGASDQSLLQRYLDRIWTDASNDEFMTILANIAANREGESIVWEYVKTNWEKIVERYSIGERTLGSLIVNVSRRFRTQSQLDDLNKFIKETEDGAGAALRAQAIKIVEQNLFWVQTHLPVIEEWAKNYGK